MRAGDGGGRDGADARSQESDYHTVGYHAQEMMADVMALMRTIAVHNPLLIHQHFSRRMDGAPHAPPSPQQPPPDFYDQILVCARAHKPKYP